MTSSSEAPARGGALSHTTQHTPQPVVSVCSQVLSSLIRGVSTCCRPVQQREGHRARGRLSVQVVCESIELADATENVSGSVMVTSGAWLNTDG